VDQANGPESAGEAPDLGKYANNWAIPGQDTGRAETLRLRETLWEWSSIGRIRKCGKVPCVAQMPVSEVPGGFRLGGLCRCQSIWACPVCAPVIRGRRGEETKLAVELHLAGGGGVSFGTATLPHGLGDRLKASYSVVSKAWASVNSDRSVKAFRKAHGWWGFCRTCEVTYGQNGWHPHLHWLDFWETALTRQESVAYRECVYRAWSRAVVRQAFGLPSESRGVVVLPVVDGDVSDYLLKVTPAAAAHELTTMTTKQARNGGLAPFDILRLLSDRQEQPWSGLWREYEQATHGRRLFGASPHLFRRIGLSELEPTAEEVGRIVAYVSSENWGRLRFFRGGVKGAQIQLERAAVRGQIGVDECMSLLMGLLRDVELVGADSEQLLLGPGDDGGMF
jgi:hypothetical protein